MIIKKRQKFDTVKILILIRKLFTKGTSEGKRIFPAVVLLIMNFKTLLRTATLKRTHVLFSLPCCKIQRWMKSVHNSIHTNRLRNCLLQNVPTFWLHYISSRHWLSMSSWLFCFLIEPLSRVTNIAFLRSRTNRQAWLQSETFARCGFDCARAGERRIGRACRKPAD